jgi:hypothetical protein
MAAQPPAELTAIQFVLKHSPLTESRSFSNLHIASNVPTAIELVFLYFRAVRAGAVWAFTQ